MNFGQEQQKAVESDGIHDPARLCQSPLILMGSLGWLSGGVCEIVRSSKFLCCGGLLTTTIFANLFPRRLSSCVCV